MWIYEKKFGNPRQSASDSMTNGNGTKNNDNLKTLYSVIQKKCP